MLQNLCNHIAMFSATSCRRRILKGDQCCSYSQSLTCPKMLTSKQAQAECTQWFGQHFMQWHRKASFYQAFITTCFFLDRRLCACFELIMIKKIHVSVFFNFCEFPLVSWCTSSFQLRFFSFYHYFLMTWSCSALIAGSPLLVSSLHSQTDCPENCHIGILWIT